MAEKFLISPSLLLEVLSKKMLYSLNHYPELAINNENIEYFCDTLQQLFNGEYRPVTFQTAMLQSCIMQYCECILIYVQNNSVRLKKSEVDYLKRWWAVLDNLRSVDSINNKFIFFEPVLRILIYQDLPPWVKKEFMLHLNRILEKPTPLIFSKEEYKFFVRTVQSWLKLIMTCGDYEFQTILVEAIISTCEFHHIKKVLIRNFGETSGVTRMFLEVYGKQNYVNDLKTFLMVINDSFSNVRSVPCSKVTLEETVIPPLKGMNGGDTWIHINYGFCSLSFECQQDSLRSLPGSMNASNLNEFVTVNFEDVDKVCLLINNDSKTVNPVGGIFLINLSGKCSCRFNSSKDIVSSIKKITLTVPAGAHLQFLKEAFVNLFGQRFKESNWIPSKKRDFYDKRDSSLNSSTPNSSFRAEHSRRRRRRRKKLDDSMNSQGNVFLKHLMLENSLTLDNKENVLESAQDYSLNSTESPFKIPVVFDHRKTTNSQLSISPIPLSTENTNRIEDSQNQCLMSPDTTTNEFMNATKSNPTLKSKGKEGRGMPESSETFLVVATTEEMTIPSNYKFGEDNNSSTILEENKSLILDFINDELNSIPDLQNLADLKNKSSDVKTLRAKNFCIADEPASKTTSNAKYQKKTSKSKKNTSVFSSKTSKPLPKSHKKDKENIKMQKEESIDNSNLLNLKNKSLRAKNSCIADVPASKTTSNAKYQAKTSKSKKNTDSVFSSKTSKPLPKSHKKDKENIRMQKEESIDNSNLLDLKNKSLRAKDSCIADVPASKTTSNAKFQAKTSKSKKNTGLVISNKTSKPLPKSHKKDKENRRMQKEESIDNSKTVGRLLRSSVKVESAKTSSEIPETSGDVCLKNKGNEEKERRRSAKKSIKIDHSSSPENTEVISNSPCFQDLGVIEISDDEAIEISDDDEKSDYCSTVQDVVPSEGNKESNQIDNNFEISVLSLGKKLISINTEEIENVEIISTKETKKDDLLTDKESEYYLFVPDKTSTENDQVYTEQYEESDNLELTVARLNSAEENKNFSNSPCLQEFNQLNSNSETPDIDVILAYSTKNIASPHKNLDEEVIETCDDDQTVVVSETPDIDSILAHSTKNIASPHKNLDEEVIETCDDYQAVVDELNANNENTNEQMRKADIPISLMENFDLQTHSLVNHQIENGQYDDVAKIPEEQEHTEDRVTISISSDEATGINFPGYLRNETSCNKLSDHSYSLAEETAIAVKYVYADIEKMQTIEINDDIIGNVASNKSNHSPGSVDDISAQLPDVPILLNEIAYRENATTISNDLLGLIGTNQEVLNKSSKSIEEFEHSYSIKSKTTDHICDSISCKEQNASPVKSKINNDVQLITDKRVAVLNDLQESKNEIARLYAELARKTQKIEELERINKERLELTPTPSVASKRPRTEEHIASQSETSNEKFQQSFQEFIESPRNRLPDNNFVTDNEEKNKSKIIENEIWEESDEETDYFQKLEKPLKGLPTELTKTNKSMEIDFEMLIARNEISSQELTISPKVSLFDMIATNDKPNVTPLICELQKSPLNKSATIVNVLSDDGNFSKHCLSDKTATGNAEKRIKLAEDVQLSRKMHKPKEDNFAKFALETSPMPKTHQSKRVNEGFESILSCEPVNVRRKPATVSGNKLNKNIEFHDIERLYNLIDKPHELSEKSPKTGENIRNKVRRDENYDNLTNKIYGFDAMLNGFVSYLKTWKTPVKKKKPKKDRIIKMKFGGCKKAKSKSKKRNFGKLF